MVKRLIIVLILAFGLANSVASAQEYAVQAVISIVSEDVPETGRASAYQPHGFRIEGAGLSVTEPQWVLQLPLANGGQESLELEDEALSCTIVPIGDGSKYRVDSDGSIEGQLRFTCLVDGEKAEAAPFRLHLELKPLIEYAAIERIEDNSPYDSYDAYYVVKYYGAEKVKVSVEEEYSSKVKTWYVDEPYIARGVADHIAASYYAWLIFTVENEYGQSVYTIELAPHGVTAQNDPELSMDDGDEAIEVSNVSGVKIGTVGSLSEICNLPYKGVLVVRRICNGKVVETGKYINK